MSILSCFQTAHEVGVSENTVSFFYQQFRSACFDYLMDMENELIGGKNKKFLAEYKF